MSSEGKQSNNEQSVTPGDEQRLADLKAELSALTKKYPATGFSFGSGAAQAQEQIPIICQNIDDAIKALNTGKDPHGNPITNRQITDGLQRLVAATRNPGFIGLVTVVLNSDGIQRFEDLMSNLEKAAEKISRPDWIATPEVQSSQMAIVLEWCERNREKIVTANVISMISEGRETIFNAAKGTIRSIQENPNQKGTFRLEFDSQEQREPYDFLMLGFEVSGADDQGNRLVIQKGTNQRIELEV